MTMLNTGGHNQLQIHGSSHFVIALHETDTLLNVCDKNLLKTLALLHMKSSKNTTHVHSYINVYTLLCIHKIITF